MAIEIVDLPMKSMVIFHSYVNVYQRVDDIVQNNTVLKQEANVSRICQGLEETHSPTFFANHCPGSNLRLQMSWSSTRSCECLKMVDITRWVHCNCSWQTLIQHTPSQFWGVHFWDIPLHHPAPMLELSMESECKTPKLIQVLKNWTTVFKTKMKVSNRSWQDTKTSLVQSREKIRCLIISMPSISHSIPLINRLYPTTRWPPHLLLEACKVGLVVHLRRSYQGNMEKRFWTIKHGRTRRI